MLPNVWQSGVVRGSDAYPAEKLQVLQQRMSQAATLADLAADYHFYTPALLYLHVRLMGRDPFHDFLIEYRKSCLPLALQFDKPVFAGLESQGQPVWNHYLYGLEHVHFRPYLEWLGSLMISDVERGLVSRLRYRELEIVDPLFMQKQVVAPDQLPRVKIVAFCLDTNHGCHYIEPAKDPLLSLPTYRYTKQSFDDTVRFAQAVLTGDQNPYLTVERGQAKDGLSVEEMEIRKRVAEARRSPDEQRDDS